MMPYYITELTEKIDNFTATYNRLPSKILLTRAVFNEIRQEIINGHYCPTYISSPMSASTKPEFRGIVIEIDDLELP